MAGAVGGEDELLAVGRPGNAVVVGRVVGQPGGLAAGGDGGQEQLAVDHEGDVPLVGGQGVLGGPAGIGDGALGVALVVGVGLDCQLARAAALGGDDGQVGAAPVDG